MARDNLSIPHIMSEGDQEAKWVCVVISQKYSSDDSTEMVKAELKRIFDEDFEDLILIKDSFLSGEGECYAFVRCRDYAPYSRHLKKSYIVDNVLPSYGNPMFIPEEEIKSFSESLRHLEHSKTFGFGDVVIIKGSYLNQLKGIVVGMTGDFSYSIYFRLYTRTFVEEIQAESMIFDSNVFDKTKLSALVYASEGTFHRVSITGVIETGGPANGEDEIHRQQNGNFRQDE